MSVLALPVLDVETLHRRIPEDAVPELLPAFLEEAEELTARLQTLWSQGDSAGARRAAHALKGTGGNMAAEQVHQLASRIQDGIDAGQTMSVNLWVQELPLRVRKLREVVEELLARA